MTSESEADTEASDRALRAVFADAAHDITPGPVPLAEVRRAGRARRRRREAVLTVGCAAVVTAVTIALVQTTSSPSAPPATPPSPSRPAVTSPAPPVPAGGPTVVAPGDQVKPADGWTLRLTQQGLHMSGPDGYEDFSDSSQEGPPIPDFSHYSHGGFHVGVYYAKNAGRMELTGRDGTRTTATLVELPGRPGWGAWYATTPYRDTGAPWAGNVTLYDTTGKAIAGDSP
ncbi:hypothetical protein [Streptomyces sp. TRM64462]|uniref:hypothetical protein n=1 Tax=Streptomyces sp. TRM64462 TaxID=2741726 RepID=UPI001585D6DB|nr:hypothetical protein [Streptomyces sp. TRM64462]